MRAALAAACACLAAGVAHGDGMDAVLGRALFERLWVAAPASTAASDGLGPVFEARSCAACHAEGGGARFPAGTYDGALPPAGRVLRLGDAQGRPDPRLGAQAQQRAVPGMLPDASCALAAADRAAEIATCRLATPLAPGMHAGFRIAPSLRNVAAMNAIPDAAIRAAADPQDADGDGISGRVHEIDGRPGRFGWKASHATLDDAVAVAFALDLGLSTPQQTDAAGDCPSSRADCRAAPAGARPGETEVPKAVTDAISAYLLELAGGRPERFAHAEIAISEATAQPDDAQDDADLHGRWLLNRAGCTACHTPAVSGFPAPYTDLLLHDLGPALDDGVGEPGIASREWRTPPLANLNIQGLGPQARSRRAASAAPFRRRYLHDGRAATLSAAISAHDGEAARSRTRYRRLSPQQRADLLRHLGGM